MKHLLVPILVGSVCLGATSAYAACGGDITATKFDNMYQDNADGTVTDLRYGLMWQKCTAGLTGDLCDTGAVVEYYWGDAAIAVQTANTAIQFGHSDWRLPNKKELASLVEKACSNPAINATAFPATDTAKYWTSSPVSGAGKQVWTIDFTDGSAAATNKWANSPSVLVRMVRDAD